MSSVELRPLTPENREECARLSVSEAQRDYVDENLFAISESGIEGYESFAVYAGRDVVGMAVFDWNPSGRTGTAVILHHFMLDERHQGRGYGKAALLSAIQLVRDRGRRRLLLSYWPGNPAVRLYESLGFSHTGERWGENAEEPVMRLDL